MTLLAWKTVRAGERAAIWSLNGEVKFVDGPARVRLFRQRLELLRNHYATQDQYLEVECKLGPKQILPGPCSLFFDPVEHLRITTHDAIFVDASEAMVVYLAQPRPTLGLTPSAAALLPDEDAACVAPRSIVDPLPAFGAAPGKTDCVRRVIIRGPARHVPDANEWVHRFKWHGSTENKTSKQAGALTFTKLRVIADQTYYNVRDVRTKDDTLLTIKIMIFFELVDIERMLDSTHDPIGDFINAVTADVIAFCAKLDYEEFLEATSSLNELDTFAQLTSNADAIGYRVNKVVFRGFHASDSLQAMHDSAIQERTRLRLGAETEQQRQKTLTMQLEKEAERSEQKLALERQEANHRAMLQRDAAEQARAMLAAEHAASLDLEAKKLEIERLRNAEELTKYKEMQALGVDLTKVLVSQHQHPDKVYRFDTGDGGAAPSKGGVTGLGGLQLHLPA